MPELTDRPSQEVPWRALLQMPPRAEILIGNGASWREADEAWREVNQGYLQTLADETADPMRRYMASLCLGEAELARLAWKAERLKEERAASEEKADA